MNLRLENNHIRFRISREEMDSLIENGVIKGSTMASTYCVKLDENSCPASLIYEKNNFTLRLTPQAVIDHKSILPSKEGIVKEVQLSDGNTMRVSLEVDVRSRRSHPNKI